jgi:NADH-quinone oxidoreductase subunit J
MSPDLAVDTMGTPEVVLFWVCGILAVAGALGLILSRKAVHSALWTALTMINLAIMYVANSAPFLGMVQVVVYTGAVMMLFLFVLMVVGVDASDSLIETLKGQRIAALALGIALVAVLVASVGTALVQAGSIGLAGVNSVDGGNVQGVARLIFTDYLVAFEITSALLITAALGAMVLAHRERWKAVLTQPERSRLRFRTPGHPGTQPNPGVYARHNAVDTPALLPDGTPAMESIPGPLQARADARPVDHADVEQVRELSQGRQIEGGEDR